MHNSKSESAPAAEQQPPTRRKDASPSRVPVPIKSTTSAAPAKPDTSLQKDTKDPKEVAKNAQKPIKKLATFAKPNISNIVSRIDSGVKATTSTTSNTSTSSTVPAATVIAKKPPSAATLKRQQSLAQLKSSTTTSNPVPSTPSIKKSVSTSSLSDTAKKPAVPAFKRMPSSLGLRKPASADAKVKNVVAAAAVVNPPASAVKPRSRANSIRPLVTKAIATPATLRTENERLKRENEELKQKLVDLTMKIANMPMISNEPTQPEEPAEPILEHPAKHPLVNPPSHEVQIEDEDAIKEEEMTATASLQDEEPPVTVDEEETYGAEEFEVDEVKMSTGEFKESCEVEAAKESLSQLSQTSLASGDFVVVSEKHVSIALPDADSTSESTEWDVTKSTRKNAARKARKKSMVAALAFGDLDGSEKEMFEGAVVAAAVAEAAEADAVAVAAAVAEGRSLRSRKPKV
ncbi:hypothetical protein BJ741DRAFT_706383 [Chytriomyces cf. hyalinus JEL632]|nr:hypothetical protein BJ741DRAFT_706383 [Chytriomyces cf. hyalinus JEL632]